MGIEDPYVAPEEEEGRPKRRPGPIGRALGAVASLRLALALVALVVVAVLIALIVALL